MIFAIIKLMWVVCRCSFLLLFCLCIFMRGAMRAQHQDGCTALTTMLTPALDYNITQPMEHILCRVLFAACSAAPETQYWSDPCVTGSQCSIAIEPGRKTRRKQPQTQTYCVLTSARHSRANASRLVRLIEHHSQDIPLYRCPSKASPVTLMAIFRGDSQRDNLFRSSKALFWKTETCSDMSEGADEWGKMSLSDAHDNHGNWASVLSPSCFEYIFIFDILWGLFWYLKHESASPGGAGLSW